MIGCRVCERERGIKDFDLSAWKYGMTPNQGGDNCGGAGFREEIRRSALAF